ncbi:MAG: hypothetical protein H6817_04165 [Phycisphaerales bacterium]|nr:hypothetical protein [Phycisphaerales bacterium]
MNRIVEIVLRTFTLLEAEGRAAKRSAFDVVFVALIWAMAAGMAFVGALAVFVAIFLMLDAVAPTPLAAGIVGVFMLGLAVAVWFVGQRLREERQHVGQD